MIFNPACKLEPIVYLGLKKTKSTMPRLTPDQLMGPLKVLPQILCASLYLLCGNLSLVTGVTILDTSVYCPPSSFSSVHAMCHCICRDT